MKVQYIVSVIVISGDLHILRKDEEINMKKIDLENLKFNNEKMSEEMLKEINGGCGSIRIVYCSGTGYKYVWGNNGCGPHKGISQSCIGKAIDLIKDDHYAAATYIFDKNGNKTKTVNIVRFK